MRHQGLDEGLQALKREGGFSACGQIGLRVSLLPLFPLPLSGWLACRVERLGSLRRWPGRTARESWIRARDGHARTSPLAKGKKGDPFERSVPEGIIGMHDIRKENIRRFTAQLQRHGNTILRCVKIVIASTQSVSRWRNGWGWSFEVAVLLVLKDERMAGEDRPPALSAYPERRRPH
jgi:hypothetical protein